MSDAEQPLSIDAVIDRASGHAAAAMVLVVVLLPLPAAALAGAALPAGAWPAAVLGGLAALLLLGTDGVAARRWAGWPAETATLAYIGVLAASAPAGLGPSAPLIALPVLHAAAFGSRTRATTVLAAAGVVLFGFGDAGRPGTELALIAFGALAGVAAMVAAAAGGARSRLRSIERVTLRDGLTGAGNYRLFARQIEAQLGRGRRHDETFSLVLVDLDDFKQINDDVGHEAGDRVLRDVAAQLRAALRTEDVLCRHGGDEFSVIAPHTAGREAERLASRLRDAVRDHVLAADGGHPVTISTGVSTAGTMLETPYDVVDRADVLLRAAKRGREVVGPAGDRTVPAPAPDRSPAQLEQAG